MGNLKINDEEKGSVKKSPSTISEIISNDVGQELSAETLAQIEAYELFNESQGYSFMDAWNEPPFSSTAKDSSTNKEELPPKKNKKVTPKTTSEEGIDKEIQAYEIEESLLPKEYADKCFDEVEGYSWNKLKELFKSEGGEKENERIKQFLLTNDCSWGTLVEEFEVKSGENYIVAMQLSDSLIIQAPTIGLAFAALRNNTVGVDIKLDTDQIFYYTDGKDNIYPVLYNYDYTPTEEQLAEIHSDLRHGLSDLENPFKSQDKSSSKETNNETFIYRYLIKNQTYKKKIDELTDKVDDNHGLDIGGGVKEIVDTFLVDHAKALKKHPVSNQFIGGVIRREISRNLETRIFARTPTKERIKKRFKFEDIPFGGMPFFQNLKEQKEVASREVLEDLFNTWLPKYLEVFSPQIDEEMGSFRGLYEYQVDIAYTKYKKKLDTITNETEKRRYEEAFSIEQTIFYEEWKTKTWNKFLTTDLWKKIEAKVLNHITNVYDRAHGLIGFVKTLNNPSLLKLVEAIDKDFLGSQTVKTKSEEEETHGLYKSPENAKYKTYKEKRAALKSRYETEILPLIKDKYSKEVQDKIYLEYHYKYSKVFLFNDDNTQASYAFFTWAEHMLPTVTAYKYDVFELNNAYYTEERNSKSLSDGRVYIATIRSLNSVLQDVVNYLEEILKHPEESKGMFEDFQSGFASLKGSDYMPIIGTLKEVFLLLEVNAAMDNAKQDYPLFEIEQYLLQSFGALMQVQSAVKLPDAYTVGKGAAESLVFATEYTITSSLSGAKAIASLGRDAAFKLLKKQVRKSVVARLLIRGAGSITHAAVMTVANPLNTLETYERFGLKVVSLKPNKDGSYDIVISEGKHSGKSEANRLFMAVASSFASNLTEASGGKLFKFLGKGVSKLIPFEASATGFSKALGKVVKIFDDHGYNGFLSEYEEEVYDQILQAAIQGELPKLSYQEQKIVFTTVLVTGGIMKGAQVSLATIQYFASFTYNNNKVDITKEILDTLSDFSLQNPEIDLAEKRDKNEITEDQYKLSIEILAEIKKEQASVGKEQELMVEQLVESGGDLQQNYEFYHLLLNDLKQQEQTFPEKTTEGLVIVTEHKGAKFVGEFTNKLQIRLKITEVQKTLSLLETKAKESNVTLHPSIPEADIDAFASKAIAALRVDQETDFATFFGNLNEGLEAAVNNAIDTFKKWYAEIKLLYKEYIILMKDFFHLGIKADASLEFDGEHVIFKENRESKILKFDKTIGAFVLSEKAFKVTEIKKKINELFGEEIDADFSIFDFGNKKSKVYVIFVQNASSKFRQINREGGVVDTGSNKLKNGFVQIEANPDITVQHFLQKTYHELAHSLHKSKEHGALVDVHVNAQFEKAKLLLSKKQKGKTEIDDVKANSLDNELDNMIDEINFALKNVLDGDNLEGNKEQEITDHFNDQIKIVKSLQDVLAALTKRKYGEGHTEKYYKVEGHPQKEFFARAYEIRKLREQFDDVIEKSKNEENNILLKKLMTLMDEGFDPLVKKIEKRELKKGVFHIFKR